MNPTIVHTAEVVEIALNQYANVVAERRLALIDRNKDLYIMPISPLPGLARGKHKLHTQVDSIEWNDSSDMLVAVADGKVVTWYYPNVVYVDRGLLALTSSSREATELGKLPAINTFFGDRVTVRKADGTVIHINVPSYPLMLYEYVYSGKWEAAVRLCRFIQSDEMWGCLAAMALHGFNLETAEIALAAVKEVDKLQYILYIKDIPSQEGRNAEMMLYKRCPDEAENILLQASPPLTYRAIKLNIRLYRWNRALELAVKYRSHVDTVLGYRQRFLETFKKQETDAQFLQYKDKVTIDWDAIKAKKEKEKEEEMERANRGGGYK